MGGNMDLFNRIGAYIEKNPRNLEPLEDWFQLCRDIEETQKIKAHENNRYLRTILSREIAKGGAGVDRLFELYRRTLLFDSTYDFDCYMQYMELDRKAPERFYLPRRKQLYEVVHALQELSEDKLDDLILSMPPRVGKTTLILFFLTWIIGREPEASNLYSAYSDTITNAMYQGINEILNDPYTYKWKEVFPDAEIASTNAKEETLNIGRRKRYPSLTCRSLYGTLNGACDCNGYLITDDLIGGIEEALNKDRLVSAWSKVDNNLIPRAKENAKILMCGTRWSVIDPQGKRIDLLQNDPRFAKRRYKVINVPALNENDESNFNYSYGVGFTSEFYQQRRASFERNGDIASWNAQYMGQPIEREGTLFAPQELKFFNGEVEKDAIIRKFMAVDPAFGGGDYVAAPICYEIDEDNIFIVDVVYTNGDKTQSIPELVRKAIKWDIQAIQVEANKMTESYTEELDAKLREQGVRINVTSKPASTLKAKEQRIFDKAPDIRESMYFLESGKRSKDYELFMQNVYSFKFLGKNLHDDAPDSLAMAIDMVRNPIGTIKSFKRIF